MRDDRHHKARLPKSGLKLSSPKVLSEVSEGFATFCVQYHIEIVTGKVTEWCILLVGVLNPLTDRGYYNSI